MLGSEPGYPPGTVGAGVCVVRLGTVADGVKDGVAVGSVPPEPGSLSVAVAPGIGVAEGVNPGNGRVAVANPLSVVEVGNMVGVAGADCVIPGRGVPVDKGVMPMPGCPGTAVPGSCVSKGIMSTLFRVPKGT